MGTRVLSLVTVFTLVLVVAELQAAPRVMGGKAVEQPASSDVGLLSPLQQAIKALKAGRVTEARVLLRDRLKASPGDLDARRLLVRLLLDAGSRSEAEALLVEGQALSPQSTDLARSLAALQTERKAFMSALETLQKSLDYAQADGPYLAFMAAQYQRLGQHVQAAGLLVQALEISPGNGLWQLALALSRKALGDAAGARGYAALALSSGQLAPLQIRQAKALLRNDASKQSEENL